ncbi:MAG: YCF48-related protein [Ignavibacteria bacterium]
MIRKITFIFVMILMVSGTLFSQDKQDWKWMHPSPQANLLRKIKMVDANTWVTAGANGTYMQTTNSGNNWYFHHFAGETDANLKTTQNYDMWFFNQNTGIVVGDQGYIGRTVNGGVSFDTVSGGLIETNKRNWAVWFADANTGYIASGAQGAFRTKLLKTTDAGLTWQIVFESNTNYAVSIGGSDANNVTASYSNGVTITTTNGGTSWTESAGVVLFTVPNNISFLNANTGFACGSEGKFSRTTNAGVNWQAIATPQVDWAYFQVKIVSDTEIYLVGDPNFLYRSSDQGSTWTPLSLSVSGPATTFIWYSLDHIGSTYVISGDYGVVAKSTDGCATWFSESNILKTALNFNITTVPGTSKYWIIGRPHTSTTGQVMYSANSGTNWTTYSIGVTGDFNDIAMINENTGYVTGTNSQVYKTTDGGISWIAKTKPHATNYTLYNCDFIDENTGWVFVNFATVPGGNVFKTTDGANTWTQYTTGATSENIYSAEMLNANTGYTTMNQSNRPVYKTINGGVNWSPLTTGLTGSIRSVTCPDDTTVYICQTSGTNRVAKSTNAGATWTLITMPATADFTSIDFKDANTGYAVGNSTTAVCRTSDGGASWSFQNTHNITNGKIYVTQGDTAWALGGNAAIMRFVGFNSQLKLDLTMLMEGMYSNFDNELSLSDDVKVYLRKSTAPYSIVDSATATIDSLTFTGSFTFPNAQSGQYYIVAKYRNTIETWSKAGGELILDKGTINTYDFTTSASQAFGNNQILKGSEYCNYSGDVTNDGTVDLDDVGSIDNDVINFVTGYVTTDLDGDGIVGIKDMSICDNNSFIFVVKITP